MNYTSTRDSARLHRCVRRPFSRGIAPDGGLFVPCSSSHSVDVREVYGLSVCRRRRQKVLGLFLTGL